MLGRSNPEALGQVDTGTISDARGVNSAGFGEKAKASVYKQKVAGFSQK